MSNSPFSSSLEARLSGFAGRVCPLHFGDTWLDPPEDCYPEKLYLKNHPSIHRYAPPLGLSELRNAVAKQVEERTGVSTNASNVLIGAGATGVLTAFLGSIVSPGDEVQLVAPYWPLIAGIVRLFGGKPIPVSFLGCESPEVLVRSLESSRTERTSCLYLSSPNNPSGQVLARPYLRAIIQWAIDHDLWIVSDEVYEDYVYDGEHTYCRALAPDHCFTVSSFSKMYGMAGHRCGYGVAATELISLALTVSTYSIYSAPRFAQEVAIKALKGCGRLWAQDACDQYRRLGGEVAAKLGIPAPQGSNFLFLDISSSLDERGLQGFLNDCADRGILVAPGESFGPFPEHVRICFTSTEPALIHEGIDRLASLLGR